ncbi:hypothetical protein ENKO_409 [Klebsiella phage fENko-Kae01]|nr:hypothetical protein [Klebsiella phage fENko-Kae01]
MGLVYFRVQYSVDGEMRDERIAGMNKYDVAANLGSKYYKGNELVIFNIQLA